MKQKNLNILAKKKQTIYGIIGVVVICIIILCAIVLSHKPKIITKNNKTPDMAGVIGADFTESDSRSALEVQQGQIDSLIKKINNLNKKLAVAEKHKTNAASKQAFKFAILEKNLDDLKQKQKQNLKANSKNIAPQSIALESQNQLQNQSQNLVNTPYAPAVLSINTISFSYEDSKEETAKSYKNYVPSGTFAKAVLLEGAVCFMGQ